MELLVVFVVLFVVLFTLALIGMTICLGIFIPQINKLNEDLENKNNELFMAKYRLSILILVPIISSLLPTYQGKISNIPIDVIKNAYTGAINTLTQTFNTPIDVANDLQGGINQIKALNPTVA